MKPMNMYFSTSSQKDIAVEKCGFFSMVSELSNTRESFESFTFLTTYVKAGANLTLLWKIFLPGKKNKTVLAFPAAF